MEVIMENTYWVKPLKKQSFFQKLFKIQPKCNMVVEINNLLANKKLNEVTLSDISDICLKYKTDIKSPRYLEDLCRLYKKYLEKCLGGNVLTDNDIDELNHLKELLSMDERETVKLHDLMCGEIYKTAYREQISEGTYSEESEELINKLQEDLRLSDDIIQPIQEECRLAFLQKYWKKIIKDNKISPAEWDSLNEIAKNLHITMDINSKDIRGIERMKLNWIIENGDLPVKRVDINLKKGEKCYYSQEIDWLELRKTTQRINYGGGSYRLKIAKGLSYKIGSIQPQRITSDELHVIDTGTIYVTNKRLIFDGNLKNTNIPYSKILSITPYSDGVGIDKDSGRSPVFQVSDDADLLAMYISRLLKDFND
jgi:hypothetical protein